MGNIAGFVKSVHDIMDKDTGVDGDAQCISQMGWMLFMKIPGKPEGRRMEGCVQIFESK